MIKKMFSLIHLAALLCGQAPFADDMTPDKASMTPPAKHFECGPACHCGCHEGKSCTCSSSQGWKAPKAPCGPGCGCGCHVGLPCSCSLPQGWAPQSEAGGYADAGGENISCGSDCGCGVGPGYTCSATNEVGCLSGVCGVPRCSFNSCRAPDQSQLACGFDTITARQCRLRGVWLPDDPPLFRNLMADPRQVCYSVGWRFDDQVLARNVIDVSFGDTIGFYRWFDVGFCGSALQIDLEGALWVTFDPLHDSSPLMNADYYGGLVLTYAYRNLSLRLRGFHISCHIGDEFLLDHPDFDRRNPSAEFLDLYGSYDLTGQIRLYGGIGWVVAQDDEFKLNPIYGAAGAEFRVHDFGFTNWCNQIYGEPVLGMHFRFSKNFKKHIDATYTLGYEWGKLCGSGRKVRLFMEYHDGYSLEGQFATKPTNYFSVRISYGY